jgi:hypothetical protein
LIVDFLFNTFLSRIGVAKFAVNYFQKYTHNVLLKLAN